jgi:hypothetical protein
MSVLPSAFFAARRFRRAQAASCALLAVVGGLLSGTPALSRGYHELIGVDCVESTVLAGDTVPVTVTLDDPNTTAEVTLYSDASGGIGFQGAVQSGDTVEMATDPSAESGPSTIYATTDGAAVVTTEVFVL